MGELFYAVALVLIVGSYAVIALMLLWNEAGPWIFARLPKRQARCITQKRSRGTGPEAARNDATVERPYFHPNL